jgi:hypothetical protein
MVYIAEINSFFLILLHFNMGYQDYLYIYLNNFLFIGVVMNLFDLFSNLLINNYIYYLIQYLFILALIYLLMIYLYVLSCYYQIILSIFFSRLLYGAIIILFRINFSLFFFV